MRLTPVTGETIQGVEQRLPAEKGSSEDGELKGEALRGIIEVAPGDGLDSCQAVEEAIAVQVEPACGLGQVAVQRQKGLEREKEIGAVGLVVPLQRAGGFLIENVELGMLAQVVEEAVRAEVIKRARRGWTGDDGSNAEGVLGFEVGVFE